MSNKKHEERAALFGGSDGTITANYLEKFLKHFADCHYCGRRVAKAKRTIDHVIPISRFGLHSMNSCSLNRNLMRRGILFITLGNLREQLTR